MKFTLLSVLYAASAIVKAQSPHVAESPQVKIGSTTLTGRLATPGIPVDFFGGIPYAKPPLGELRLKPPVLLTTLNTETFDATSYGAACLQPPVSVTPGFPMPPVPISEDCLTINVLRPSGTPAGANLPVMFWTYGGGFDSGVSAMYEGTPIVAQSVARGTPVVYVGFNYRLGPLGFPQGQEADTRKALNLGIKDHHAALQWVQENIDAFGGDKTKVTVFGESAGAMINAISFLDPNFGKLARAGIFESGSAATPLTFDSERRQGAWEAFVGAVSGCESLASTDNTFGCLQNASTEAIHQGLLTSLAEATEQLPFDPAIDGPGGVYPDFPSKLFAEGHFSKLPFIAGANQDEGTLFANNFTYTTELLETVLKANYSPPLVPAQMLDSSITRLLELYPDVPALGSPFNTGNETFGKIPGFKRAAALFTDLAFQSQRRSLSQTVSNAGVKTYAYLFTQPQPNFAPSLGGKFSCKLSFSELGYVYGTTMNSTPSDLRLSLNMIDYWVSFATSLDPNDGLGSPRPVWSQYTPDNQVVLQLNGDNTTLIPDDYRKEGIDFINSMPLVWHH
ncbi:extracellular triacylglycerol lipase precursor [Dendrothele bispora CBS 962.96]|uniref:Carboxylic ester hydrolase n=1 Tax=Dendrothele bispora (strain CBS 962.96) TaxID=1314807 RepID=A0A4S8ME01_DENBC|nr:extracellular triacylglycerol lipase precursor [Dendrothele bispora CBS 962.96]